MNHSTNQDSKSEVSSLNANEITDAIFPVFRTTIRNRYFGDRETWRCLGWHRVKTVSYLEPNSEALIKMLAAKWNNKPRFQAGWEDALRKRWAVTTIDPVHDMMHDNPMKGFFPGPKLDAAEMLAILRSQGAKRHQENDTVHKTDGGTQQLERFLSLGDHLSTRTRDDTLDQGVNLLRDLCSDKVEDATQLLESMIPEGPMSRTRVCSPPTSLSQGNEAKKQGADPVLIPTLTDPHGHIGMTSQSFDDHFDIGIDNSWGLHDGDGPSELSGSDSIYSKEDLAQAFGPIRSKLKDLNATRAEPNCLAFILVIEPFAINCERFELIVSSNLQLLFLPPPSSTTKLNPAIDASMHYGGSVLANLIVPVFRVPENMPRRGRAHGPWYYCGFYEVLSVAYPERDDYDLISAIERKYSVELRNTKRRPRKGYAVVEIERRERSATVSPMEGISPVTETALADIIAEYEGAAAANTVQRSVRMAMKASERDESLMLQNRRARATRSPGTPFRPASKSGNQYWHSVPDYEVKQVDLQSRGLQIDHDSEASEDEQSQTGDRQSRLYHLNVPASISHGEKPNKASQQLISFDESDEEVPVNNPPESASTAGLGHAADSLAILSVPGGQPVEPEEDLLEFEEWELAKKDALNPRTLAERGRDEKAALGTVERMEWPKGSLYNLPRIQHYHPRRFVNREDLGYEK